jgi:hypothetical protein
MRAAPSSSSSSIHSRKRVSAWLFQWQGWQLQKRQLQLSKQQQPTQRQQQRQRVRRQVVLSSPG